MGKIQLKAQLSTFRRYSSISTMRQFLIFAAIVAFAVAEDTVEQIETREICRKGEAETPGPRCITEVTKREKCIMKPNGPIKCKRIQDDVHQIIETRFECRRGMEKCDVVETKEEMCFQPGCGKGKRLLTAQREITAEEGPVVTIETRETCRRGADDECTSEVLKREKCIMKPNGPIKCKRVEEEDHEKMVTREMCQPGAAGRPHCRRVFEARDMCKTGAAGRPHCGRSYEARDMCKTGAAGRPHCGRELDEREMGRFRRGPHHS